MGVTQVRHPKYTEYDEFLDDAGEPFYHDKQTGEWLGSTSVDVPLGSRVLTPAQVRAQTEYRNRGEAMKQTRSYNREASFYFVEAKDRRQTAIRPQTLARVFFAATFLRFNDDRLYLSSGALMLKNDLARQMKLGSSAFKDFWKEVSGQYIFPQEDGSLKMSAEFFRGVIGQERLSGESAFQQVFIKSLREIFWQTPPKKHRYLGYLFMVLHQISWEYNVLCWNPQEQDRSKIQPMSLDEFCQNMGALGCSENQRLRFLDAFRELKFNIGETEQYLLAYLQDLISGKYYLVVNPFLLYRGHDRSLVDGFGTFFPNISST